MQTHVTDAAVRALPCAENAVATATCAVCRVAAETLGYSWQAVGPQQDLGVIYKRFARLPLRDYFLTPKGPWGCRETDPELWSAYVELVAQLCRDWRCRRLTWNFRYDAQGQMELALARLGRSNCEVTESYKHFIPLRGESFEQFLSQRVTKITRQQVRQGLKTGVEFRNIDSPEDLDQFYRLHRMWADQKRVQPHQREFFQRCGVELSQWSSLVGVFSSGALLAGLLIWRDRYFWSAGYIVRDYEKDKRHAVDVLFAGVLEEAIRQGVRGFNLGGSAGIQSLEFFKERWGAEKRPTWRLK